jgi:hypothetical protein
MPKPTCATCLHAETDGTAENLRTFCHLNPPTATPVIQIVEDEDTGRPIPTLLEAVSLWPVVMPHQSCGQHTQWRQWLATVERDQAIAEIDAQADAPADGRMVQ